MNYPQTGKALQTVVFDFDGTLAEDTWPAPFVGEPIEEAIELIRHYYNEGYAIVIFTARPASHIGLIHQFLSQQRVNALIYDIIPDKPRADLYIDDKSWRPSWAPSVDLEEPEDDGMGPAQFEARYVPETPEQVEERNAVKAQEALEPPDETWETIG